MVTLSLAPEVESCLLLRVMESGRSMDEIANEVLSRMLLDEE